ncbi:MAG: GH3 auxin-responsive promoter family protein [Fuerstiella sp.]
MPSVPLRNRIRSAVASIVRRRMIRAKDRFLKVAHTSCRETQHKTLTRLLALNADSRFSARHGLSPNPGVAEFRRRLKPADYEVFRPWIDQMVAGDHRALLGSQNTLLMYAVTSGTTAAAKLIPVTQQFVNDYRRGWQFWGMGVYQQHPALALSKIVQISSTHKRWKTSDGIPCGNISGLASAMQKKLVRKLYTIPAAVAGISEAAAKQQTVATFALADPWVGMFVTANPATLLQLMDCANNNAEAILRDIHDGNLSACAGQNGHVSPLKRLLPRNPQRAQQLEQMLAQQGRLEAPDCWPSLVCLGVWTGGSSAAYRRQLQDLFPGVPIRDHGLHASEGRMTIPFEDDTPSGLLDVETHFFEFIPYREHESSDPVVLQAHELEADQDYFILLTTSSGLYRYNIYDVVRCTGFHGTTPLISFLHKGAHISSITGEKITESQVVSAVRAGSESTGLKLKQFTLTPIWGQPPGYRLFLRISDGEPANPDLCARLATETDQELSRLNCEYADKRGTSRLRLIDCQVLSDHLWQAFEKNRIKESGGSPEQYKHPCLMPDRAFEGRFIRLTEHTE